MGAPAPAARLARAALQMGRKHLPLELGEEVRLKEGSKRGGERQEMCGQERGRGGCLQGDREEGVRGWGSETCTALGGGYDEPSALGVTADQAAPTPLAAVPLQQAGPFPSPSGDRQGDRSALAPQAGFCCLLPRDPNRGERTQGQRKHQGGTESSADLRDTGCSSNRFPICGGTPASSNCPFPAHGAGLRGTTNRHPAARAVWRLLSAATGGLR